MVGFRCKKTLGALFLSRESAIIAILSWKLSRVFRVPARCSKRKKLGLLCVTVRVLNRVP